MQRRAPQNEVSLGMKTGFSMAHNVYNDNNLAISSYSPKLPAGTCKCSRSTDRHAARPSGQSVRACASEIKTTNGSSPARAASVNPRLSEGTARPSRHAIIVVTLTATRRASARKDCGFLCSMIRRISATDNTVCDVVMGAAPRPVSVDSKRLILIRRPRKSMKSVIFTKVNRFTTVCTRAGQTPPPANPARVPFYSLIPDLESA